MNKQDILDLLNDQPAGTFLILEPDHHTPIVSTWRKIGDGQWGIHAPWRDNRFRTAEQMANRLGGEYDYRVWSLS